MLYSHNKACDVKHWAGEAALEGFEESILAEDLAEAPTLDAYETVIENFWPLFIAEAALE